MKMKKFIYPVVALALAGCVSDEGNYTYRELNKVQIKGLETYKEVLSKIDRLQFTPEVIGSIAGDDDSNYVYQWYVCGTNHNHRVISTEKNLDWVVDLPPGGHSIYLVVKDKETGLETQQRVDLSVKTAYSKGFLVLGEVPAEGKLGMDMLTMPAGRDTTMVEDVFDNTKLNLQKPDQLLFSGSHYRPEIQTLYMLADDRGYNLTNGSEFNLIAEFNDMAIIELDMKHEKPMKLRDVFPHQGTRVRSGSNRGFITDDVVAFGAIISGQYFTQPVNRYSASSSVLFKPFPWVFCYGAYSTTTYQMIYDLDADQFAKLPASYTYYCTVPKDYTGDPWMFNAKSENRTIVYGENGYEGTKGYCYAIMKDKTGDTRYIYRWLVGTSAYAAITKSPLYTVDTSLAVDFDKASHYMFSSNRTSVLYSVGNRLYQYDYARGLVTYKDFDGEITCLEAEYCSKGSISEFFVCTWSDSAKGMIYKMNVPNDPNKVEFEMLPGQQWPTRLRVKDIEWKNAT